jgi:hypothetical protein
LPIVQVLYNFLVEFSNFDWDHYCLSLLGPVPLKDLPNGVVTGRALEQEAQQQHAHRTFMCITAWGPAGFVQTSKAARMLACSLWLAACEQLLSCHAL